MTKQEVVPDEVRTFQLSLRTVMSVSHDAVAALYMSSSELACGSLGLMSVSSDAVTSECGFANCYL